MRAAPRAPRTSTLEVRRPFDPAPLVASSAAHAVPGAEQVDVGTGTVRRLVDVGRPVDVTVRLSGNAVRVTAVTRGRDEHARVLRTVRDWFDLDAEPEAIAELLRRDPLLAGSVGRRPGLRVLGHPSGWELAVQTVVGQQVSVAAGRTFTGRLVDAFGADGPGGLRLFPGPSRLAGAGPVDLQTATGLTHARARTVHALAELCASGLPLGPTADGGMVRSRLLAVPGIGPWTVEYVALRALGDRDAFPSGDLVLRRASGLADARALARRAQDWAPLRAYAAAHLWACAAELSPRRPPGRRG